MRVVLLLLTAALLGCRSGDVKQLMPNTTYQLSLLKIPVTDVRRSADFYRDALGFHEEFVVEQYGWAQLKAGELPLALYIPGKGGGDGHVGGSTGFHLSLPPQRFDPLAADFPSRGRRTETNIR